MHHRPPGHGGPHGAVCGHFRGVLRNSHLRFFRGAQLSREAAQYNEAVMLCRSQAERLRAGEALPEHSCFDGSFAQCGLEDAEYLLSTAAEPRQGCVCWTLTVSTPEGEALYRLDIFMEEARR